MQEYSGEPVERSGSSGGVAGGAVATNGELSANSTSSAQPASHGMARSSDGSAYAAGGSGSVSSQSMPHSSSRLDGVWNDRPASVHAVETSSSYQYSNVVPPSQRQPAHSNSVQEYDVSVV